MGELTIRVYGMTDTGLRRDNNEDAIHCDPAGRYAMVADGMGGHNAGEVASALAVSVLRAALEPALAEEADAARLEEHLRETIGRANQEIFQGARLDPKCAGMGTTLALCVFHPAGVLLAHVGDSRIYRLRGERLELLTADHSLIQELLDTGFLSEEEARNSQNKNLITRALGIADTVEPDLRNLAAEPGDLYLLCSDGLTDLVSELEIEQLLVERGESLESAVPALIQRANEHGGRDNVSVILARMEASVSPTPRASKRAAKKPAKKPAKK